MNPFRRHFRFWFRLGVSASLPTGVPRAGFRTKEKLDVSDDEWIGGYRALYHGRATDPKPFVDLVTIVGRTGGCSAGFLRRWMLSIAETPEEANDAIAYLNRGLRDGWLIYGRPRSSGIPLVNLHRLFDDVPPEVGRMLDGSYCD